MFRKTDSEIQRDVMEALKAEPRLSPERIGVAVHEGVVTLSGQVSNYAQKSAAEKAALRVRGVRGVAEEIDVHLESSEKRGDVEIAEAAVRALRWHIWAPDHLQVKVEDGWVTLSGEVDFYYQRNSAVESVRYLTGVRGVTNAITIKQRVEVQDIKDAIEQSLVRDAELEANQINVDADGGTVTLRGHVHSAWERTAASKAAWRIPGVCAVKNELEVT
ncbi:BON domain-containing protein [Roseiconus nitratireducens]|uniref:BON domain-containing protein n=1 Tax=Roseiconus nitratireducens TaxID=2605748 RepID=A0A5M6D3I1_9BACT|nr:BON domain-containing protein [Roseiconus nitratireducens]KAA5539735.1 BON domain-containing protein [Roseiconus nitratireducens]